MKNIKVSLSVLAILFGFGLSFFNANSVKADTKKATISWFDYNGSGNVNDPANYTEVSGTPTCSGSEALCAIQATADANREPVMTVVLENEISNDLSTDNSSSHVKLRN